MDLNRPLSKAEVKALFVDDITLRKKAIKAFVMAQANSFEDRFEVWKETPYHLCDVQNHYVDLHKYENKYGEISWYDDFYVERHETVDLRDIVERMQEGGCGAEEMKDFITECMDNGYFAFEYDW